MKTLEEISSKTYYSMEKYHQITIDYVDEVESVFSDIEEDYDSNVIESLLALSYNISNILETINPLHTEDIDILNSLNMLINAKIKEIEDFNKYQLL